jgi:hypothetical protein
MRTFEDDLEIGQRAEECILKKLQLVYPTMRRIKVKNTHFDLIDDSGLTIEVKLDLKSKDTGNIGIEYMHRDKPSGISISQAQRWVFVYYLHGWVWSMIETDKLREYIKENQAKYDRIMGHGDKSSLILIECSEIAKDFNLYPIE